ncbi:hypothetical protein ME763_37145 (plasmid) [Streptomyces murinus]|uniref:hypothetical protein n=1 Tax=Streptomyces murinus TaxID=33900 RepID=UPI000A23287F|nr:hypothetical protein [Streptomyces murinus]WDO11351.1 hypothetical protein ME763_37145 [Streptomyces murinus]
MLSATRIHADQATVTVVSDTKDITDWALRYFGGWWNAISVEVPTPDTGVIAGGGALLLADVDSKRLTDIETLVGDYDHDEVDYTNARTLVARHEDGAIYAIQPAERLAYHYDPAAGRLVIVGAHAEPVAVAASRLARELICGQLLRAGFHILHASCVVRDGRALLTFGPKGAGKTTSALLLAREGYELLANDRVFIRPERDGLRILPWPSAAAIGFGLLDSTGLYEPLRARVLIGEEMHPTQDQRVTDALHAGSKKPIWNAKGKELKPQFFPDQLTSILRMKLCAEANAAALLFPTVNADAKPHVTDTPRALGEEDFFTGKTEDRYPDIFRLAPTKAAPVTDLADRLAQLPRRALVLNHCSGHSAELLAKSAELLPE